ncbi:hypothetical protein BDV96DRAFT_574167 [Lophiotrema nucula]|uniref:Uncharacterized protein n=1 Tax=Lophiotrema nucula TaxID=690887 RepID=A0A6A5ZB29_9PLEO|nr:hypothetical protein BDV96DRAFT_574167 [Lophiotrema nucula]
MPWSMWISDHSWFLSSHLRTAAMGQPTRPIDLLTLTSSAEGWNSTIPSSEHATTGSIQIPIAAPCTKVRPSILPLSRLCDDDKPVSQSDAHLNQEDTCKDGSTAGSTNPSISDMATAQHHLQSAEQQGRPVLMRAGGTHDPSRRKTLQTVSELSSPTQSLPEWTSGSSTVTNNSSQTSADTLRNGIPIRSTASEDQQRTLPNNNGKLRPRSTGFEKSVQPRPSILITSPDDVPIQPVRRSMTAPLNMGQRVLQSAAHESKDGARSGANRLSVSFAFRSKSRKEDASISTDKRRYSGPVESHSSASHVTNVNPQKMGQSNNHLGLQLKHSGSVQERRDRERARREQAAVEAQTRRSAGRRISVGSASTLPSMSPLPLTKPTPAHTGARMSQQQLLQNSRSMNRNRPSRYLDKRTSTGQLQKQTDKRTGNDIDAQLLKGASTANMNVGRRASNPNMLNQQEIPGKALYSASNPKRSSRVLSQHSPMPLILGSPTSMSFSTPQSPTQYPFPRPPSGAFSDGRTSRSMTQSHNAPTRTSSAHSNTSAASSKSNISRHSNKSRQSSTSRSSNHRRSRRQQRGVTQEHLDALAALTAPAPSPSANMTPESLTLLESQQKIVDEKIRRQSVASERALRISLARERSQSRGSQAGSRISHGGAENTRVTATDNAPLDEKQYAGMAPESVRLLREREKLLRWKAEREKVEFEKRERDKIRERVKRANEMEEARSRSLKEERKEGRGCCGLFGK